MQFDDASGRLILPNLYNTRDLGGMPYGDGKKTASHRLIRSDALTHITSSVADELASYPVNAIIDLRSEAEATNYPDQIKDDPRFTYYNIPLLVVNADDVDNSFIRNVIATSLGDMYVWMWENAKERFAMVLRTILKERPGTVLFHCAHGKDRTGLITAIFYLLMGVSYENIIQNYAVSYEYVAELVAPLIADTEEKVHHIYRSDATNMQKLLAHFDKEYGGDITKYLLSCGLSTGEIESLKQVLL